MALIEDYIANIYTSTERYSTLSYVDSLQYDNTCKYIEIPMHRNGFELPVLALDSFEVKFSNGIYIDDLDNTLAFAIEYKGANSRFKSVNRIMQDALVTRREDGAIIISTGEENDNRIYFVAHGVVFDHNFIPIMMCSYNVNIHSSALDYLPFTFTNPTLRISPECYCNPVDAVQKFIVKKMPQALFYQLNAAPKLIVEDIPFKLIAADPPTISTKNTNLLKVVSDHIDELFT